MLIAGFGLVGGVEIPLLHQSPVTTDRRSLVMVNAQRRFARDGIVTAALIGVLAPSVVDAAPSAYANVFVDVTTASNRQVLIDLDGYPQYSVFDSSDVFGQSVDTNGVPLNRSESGIFLGPANGSAFARAGEGYGKAQSEARLDVTFGWATTQSTAGWKTLAAPSALANAVIGGQFDGGLTLFDTETWVDRADAINAAYQLDKTLYTGPGPFPFGNSVSAVGSSLYMSLSVREVETGNSWTAGRYDVVFREFRMTQFPVGTNSMGGGPGCDLFGGSVGDYCVLRDGNSAFSSFGRRSVVNGLENEFAPELNIFVTSNAAMSTQHNYTFGMPAMFDSSKTYDIELTVQCVSNVFLLPGFAAMPPTISTGCDASKSGYWQGLTDFTDANGNPVAPFTLTEIGTGRSLNGPGPFGPAIAVPEPAQWALLIAGFGLVGGAARRRRHVFALAQRV